MNTGIIFIVVKTFFYNTFTGVFIVGGLGIFADFNQFLYEFLSSNTGIAFKSVSIFTLLGLCFLFGTVILFYVSRLDKRLCEGNTKFLEQDYTDLVVS